MSAQGSTASPPWAAHAAAHGVFDAYLEALYDQLDEGLATLVLAMRLRIELRRHLDFEERVVLPRCRGRAAEAVDNVRRDHGLIRSSFERVEEIAFLRAFGRADARLSRHAVVHLDRLLHHHDEREADALYGSLAGELSASERTEIEEQLACLPLQAVPTAKELQAIVQHPIARGLAGRYRAWLEDEDLAEISLSHDLPARVSAALPKLVARDDHVVRRERALASAPMRERAAGEMLAEVSLRSTLTFVLEGMLGS